MGSEKAYEGEISLTLLYKQSETSVPQAYNIESERIGYLMVEEIYENERILPVIYVSVNLNSDMYTKIANTRDYSEFRLRIRKRNLLTLNL